MPDSVKLQVKRSTLFFLFGFTFFVAFAQKKHTISGYVSDGVSQEKLIGAVIYDTRTKSGTTANSFGFFSLTLPSDTVSLVISYLGYAQQKRTFFLSSNTSMNIDLGEDNQLSTVEVTADQSETVHEKNRMSSINIPVEQIKKIPALFGETDVLKVLQLLPGVKSGEGSTGLYVRGGGPDQNLILLDGAPVYNASHLFGFFSTFNSNAVKNVELTKGGFPARYGGRLSSVIDINLKDGNMRDYNVEGGIGIVSGKLMVEGPIIKDKTSFILTARRTFALDLLVSPIIRSYSNGAQDGGYYFYDFNAKINHKFSDKDKVFVSFYSGLDKFFFRINNSFAENTSFEAYLRWGNRIGSARWTHIFNSRLFCNANVSYTEYRFGVGFDLDNKETKTLEQLEYISGINDWAGRVNFDFLPSPDHYIRFGGNYIYHTFQTGAQAYKTKGPQRDTNTFTGNPDIFATDVSVYAEDDWKISNKLKLNIGFHAAGFLVQNNFYPSIQPRVSARYLLPKNWSVKASYAEMMQFVHLLSNSNIGLPTDLWVPVTKQIKPQQSYQGAAGVAKTLGNNMFEVSIEGYYKYMKNIIDYLDGANFIGGAKDWEKKVDQGRGTSYGAEFFIQKKKGIYSGWIGYTLSWTDRQFANINFGNVYPYKYDRRHDISIVNVISVNDKFDFSFTWVYGTGNAISLPLQTYNAAPLPGSFASEAQYYGAKNNYRMAPYHRFDLALNYHKDRKWGTSTWNLSVYNAYARQNPYFLYFSYGSGQKELKQVSLFSIIPSISWSFVFSTADNKPKPEKSNAQP
jgi:hypothetical protein